MNTDTLATSPTDLQVAQCASEPIRIPGAIQPHGWLAAVDWRSGGLVAFSENWSALLQSTPDMLAARIEGALDAVSGVRPGLIDGEGPVSCGTLTIGGRRLHVSGHRLGGLAYFELEADTDDAGNRAPIYSLARHLVPMMQRTDAVSELCRIVVAEMKRLTGFGRCLAYRFDADGHGEVLAEAIDPGYDAYAGHRFPGSDIPPQARELYRINHIRLIADAHYEPVPVRFVDGRDGTALDLSQAALRSVSPVHLEYMRNMGTLASMSVSIIVDGKLWGLVSCHDHAPRQLSWQARMACEHLGQLLSLQIEAKEENEQVTEQLRLRQRTLAIVAHLSDSDATLQRLVEEPGPLLRLARATGAAVILNDSCWAVGETPDHATLLALGQWLGNRIDQVWHSDRLPVEAASLGSEARGDDGHEADNEMGNPPGTDGGAAGDLDLEAASASSSCGSGPRSSRPSAGPATRARNRPSATTRALHPRRSFASWQQQIRGRSLPWSPSEIHAVPRIAPGADRHRAAAGRGDGRGGDASWRQRRTRRLEAFSYTVSHDLRAPMRHIAGYVDLRAARWRAARCPERSRRYLAPCEGGLRASPARLVDALLDFSRMGRAGDQAAARSTPNHLIDDLIARAEHAEQRTAASGGPCRAACRGCARRSWCCCRSPCATCVTNAVKYTRPAIRRASRSPASTTGGGRRDVEHLATTAWVSR